METTDDRDLNVKPPPLSSDQVNYLIWRYLQESGYGEAAVKLQRDWNIQPEELPFAKHVKGQALVKLVQYGLRYHHIQVQVDETGRSSKSLQPSMFFFGPESLEPAKAVHESLAMRPSSGHRQSSPEDASANGLRKHAREQDPDVLAQPTPKRPRKITNANNTPQPQATSVEIIEKSDAMEIDAPANHNMPLATPVRPSTKSARPGDPELVDEVSAGINGGRGMDVHASVIAGAATRIGAFEPHDQAQLIEPLPPPPTLTNGNSIGVQSEDPAKIADLSPNTTILSTPQGQGLDVTKTLWRGKDSSIVTGYGSEFCGIWNSSPARPPAIGHPPPYYGIFDKNDNLYVSAVAWDQTGAYLAIATYTNEETRGRLSLYSYEGNEVAMVETLPASQRMITRLHWANHQTLIGLAPCDDPTAQADRSSVIILWDTLASNIMGPDEAIRYENVPELINDLDSSIPPRGNYGTAQTPGYICLAGEDVAYQYQVRGSTFGEHRRWTEQDSWTFVKCSNLSQFVVAASDQSVWIPASNLVLRDRHSGSIVDLQVRPRIAPDINYNSRGFVEEFATASDDNTIRVWSYDSQKNTADIIFKVKSPSMALSYSSDGNHLAGAKADKLQVWNADRQQPPVANWDGAGSSWRGANVVDDERTTNGDVSMNGDFALARGDHSLSWDAQGSKIAFGLGEQIAVIDFQPS